MPYVKNLLPQKIVLLPALKLRSKSLLPWILTNFEAWHKGSWWHCPDAAANCPLTPVTCCVSGRQASSKIWTAALSCAAISACFSSSTLRGSPSVTVSAAGMFCGRRQWEPLGSTPLPPQPLPTIPPAPRSQRNRWSRDNAVRPTYEWRYISTVGFSRARSILENDRATSTFF